MSAAQDVSANRISVEERGVENEKKKNNTGDLYEVCCTVEGQVLESAGGDFLHLLHGGRGGSRRRKQLQQRSQAVV